MLNGRGELQLENPLGPIARTRQYIDAGSPLIHGSATGTAAAGVLPVPFQISAFSAVNCRLVESSNWYRSAPRTGRHANAGVRENVGTPRADSERGSFGVRRKDFSPPGTARRAPLLEPVAAGTTTMRPAASAAPTTSFGI